MLMADTVTLSKGMRPPKLCGVTPLRGEQSRVQKGAYSAISGMAIRFAWRPFVIIDAPVVAPPSPTRGGEQNLRFPFCCCGGFRL